MLMWISILKALSCRMVYTFCCASRHRDQNALVYECVIFNTTHTYNIYCTKSMYSFEHIVHIPWHVRECDCHTQILPWGKSASIGHKWWVSYGSCQAGSLQERNPFAVHKSWSWETQSQLDSWKLHKEDLYQRVNLYWLWEVCLVMQDFDGLLKFLWLNMMKKSLSAVRSWRDLTWIDNTPCCNEI